MKRMMCLLAALLLCLAACGTVQAPTAEQYLAQGKQCLAASEWPQAEENYRAALAQQPASEDAARGLIAALAGDGQKDEALAQAYEDLYATGAFTDADFAALAAVYARLGETVKQRDMLEKRYRLTPDEAALAQLEAVVADAAQETDAVRAQVEALGASLAAGDDAAVVRLLADAAWTDALAPRPQMGRRRYRAAVNDTPLRIETGRDAQGLPYTRLWYGEDGSVRYYSVEAAQAAAAQLARTGGAYTGAFRCISCDLAAKAVYQDSGTLAGGVLTGAYASEVGTAQGESVPELFAAAAAAAKTAYAGTFSDAGITQEAQQTAVTGAAGVVYAYNADKTKFLYLTFAEGTDAETAVFDSTLFGIAAFPEW